MSDFEAIADRVEIEALRGEFTDAGMMDDYDRFAALFTPDGVWRIPAFRTRDPGSGAPGVRFGASASSWPGSAL
jgi:hypothetical protein